MLMNWLSLRDSSSLLRFYYIGLRKYPLMWILPKFSVPAVCTDQNSTYKFYFIPKGRISPNWYFLFNCEDLGEWERWERKAEVILTARDVLFFWITFPTMPYATIYMLRTACLQGAEKDGEMDLLAIMWTPITKAKPSCCVFHVFFQPDQIQMLWYTF